MTRSQELKPICQVDLNFVCAFPEVKRVPLLLLLTHSDFEDFSTFREQVRFLGSWLRHFTTNPLSSRDLSGASSCKVGPIELQMSRLDGPIRPDRWPRVLTPKAYL
jgi:hypothetical protein